MGTRHYQGISPGLFSSKQRAAMLEIDQQLRALSASESENVPATSLAVTSAPNNASYLTVTSETALSGYRRVVVVSPITGTDAGARSTYSLGLSTSALVALLAGTPANTYGTTFAAGSASTFVRTDGRLKYPTAIMSAANSSTLTLTDDATSQTLTGSLGVMSIVPGTGIDINFPASTAASLSIKPNAATAAGTVVSVQGRPTAGTRTLMAPNWFSPAAGDIFSGQTFRCWDAQFSSILGQHTSSTFVGHDISVMTISPSASSGADNKAYGFRAANLTIGSGNGSWAEVATAYFPGADRILTSFKADVLAGVIVEPPTGCNKKQDGTTDVDQIGLLIRQRAAEGTAPTNRVGLDIEAQNTGTNRYAIRTATDTSLFAGITLRDATDIVLNATTGSKIGTATTQKLGLWNAAPVAQYATTGTVIGHTGGGGTALTHSDTFTGNIGATAYTVGDCVRCLKLMGAMAA